MDDVSKKISFGFSKSKVSSVKKSPKATTTIQYISCFDNKAIVLKKGARADKAVDVEASGDVSSVVTPATVVPVVDDAASGASRSDPAAKHQTLEQQAAEELLRDAQSFNSRDHMDGSQSLVLQIARAKNRVDSEVSTREDYEQVPVENFGLAMLRGMGWDSSRGIGKRPRLVSVGKQVLRPKGVGLGAERRPPPACVGGDQEQQLEIKVGTFLKVTAGAHKDKYGKIVGVDEETGRLIVALSCDEPHVSVNQASVQLVSKQYYDSTTSTNDR